MAQTYRADHVGSLLRPQVVIDARAAWIAGTLPLERLRAIEDAAILEALELQREVGIDVYTDGEFRRSNWTSDFTDAVEGWVDGERPMPLPIFRGGEDGADPAPGVTLAWNTTKIIGGPLRAKRRLTEHEQPFLRAHAPGPYKVTMPAPSYVIARGYKPGVSDKAYPSRAHALHDAALIIRDELRALAAEGVPYLQLDDPHYPDYIEDAHRERMRDVGIDPEHAIAEDIEHDNLALRGVDRSGVTIGMHLCRGNGAQGSWFTRGGYDRIAEQVFGSIDVDAFLLEYDSARAGGFEPLRFVPKGKRVVLGLVTTKAGTLESQDVLLRRIDEASKYVPMDDLALSPQCGFASVMIGSALSADDQRRKLELVVDTARRAWT